MAQSRGLFRHRRGMGDGDSHADSWLVTYADAVTLILTFLLIMLSISEPIDDKLLQISEALSEAGFVGKEADLAATGHDKEQLYEQVERLLIELEQDDRAAVELYEDGVLLELSSTAFFQPESAKFTEEAVPLLDQTAALLTEYVGYGIEIHAEGHTDDSELQNFALYPSNWELSTARATSVIVFFIENGIPPEKLKVVGYGDTRPKVPNHMADGTPIPENQDLNRRVTIKVEYLQ